MAPVARTPARTARIVIVILVLEHVPEVQIEAALLEKAIEPTPGGQLVRTRWQQSRCEIADIEIRLLVPIVVDVFGHFRKLVARGFFTAGCTPCLRFVTFSHCSLR
jgi:hypothetical protein